MKALMYVVLVAALVAPLSQANAQAKRGKKRPMAEEMSGQGYGAAGCGLGSIVFGPQPGMIQVVAATLNGTGVQTVGITVGTSNCDMSNAGQAAAQYIEMNNVTLRTELSRGQGETIDGLASILKCDDSRLFGEQLRQDYGTIMEDGISSYETTRRIQQSIDKNPALKATCSAHAVVG